MLDKDTDGEQSHPPGLAYISSSSSSKRGLVFSTGAAAGTGLEGGAGASLRC